MSVASFKLDEADQTANVSPTMKTDINGDKCALIKIATTQKNFSFDVGSLGVTTIEWQNTEHPGEIWLYVPAGVMKISIQHPQFGSIKDYDLGMRVKKGRTYNLELTSDQVNTLIVDYDNSQTLNVEITPQDAELYINGLKQDLDAQGHTSIQLPFGTHSYRVIADNYHPEESQVIINDKANKQNLSVHLKPAFGYLNVNTSPDIRGCELFIDGIRIGNLPISKYHLKSGLHRLTVSNKLYLPYSEDVVMKDTVTISITPILKPNYSECEILVEGDKDSQIFDNGDLLGTGHWRGKLAVGSHRIEAKKKGHTTISQMADVKKDTPLKISLSKPKPIYGTLEVKTTPSNASVYLDNNPKPIGSTNLTNNQVLIGHHHVKIVLDGHKTEEFDVDIKEGQINRINRDLTDYCNVTVYSNPIADISINGKVMGKTPLRINRVAGDYHITLDAEGYYATSKNIHLDSKSQDITINLKRNYVRPTELYMQAGCDCNIAGSLTINLGLGCYIKNFNIECNYLGWGEYSDRVFWHDQTGKENPIEAKYKHNGGSAKFGYGLSISPRIRLTPQIGGRYIRLESDNYIADKANALSLSLGLRCNIAVGSKFGISISPEYLVGVSKSNGYKAISDISSKIKGYTDGFNLNVGLNLYFTDLKLNLRK